MAGVLVPMNTASAAPGDPTISVDDVEVTEGDAGTKNATFTISISEPTDHAVTVEYATADGTATVVDNDYGTTSGTALIEAGTTTETVSVPVNGDETLEDDESFTFQLSNPQGTDTTAPGNDLSGQGTIVDDDRPSVTISDASSVEDDPGPGTTPTEPTTNDHTFTVSLSEPATQPVELTFGTQDGTATGGPPGSGDYTTTSQTVNFAVGESEQTVTVPVNADISLEDNESYTANLGNGAFSTDAKIVDGTGTGTIIDDDTPTVSVDDTSDPEGDSGQTNNATFNVSLSKAIDRDVVVHYSTADDTATAGSDYTQSSGDVIIPANQTTVPVNIPIKGDTVYEGDETFTLNLSDPQNATLGDSSGTATIVENETPPPGPAQISINDVTQAEGDSEPSTANDHTFTISLDRLAPQGGVTVNYATSDGSATAPGDYTSSTGTATIAEGTSQTTVTVPVSGDTTFEQNEDYTVTLSNPQNGVISDGSGMGTITNEDVQPPQIRVDNVTGPEGNSEPSSANDHTFTISLHRPADQAVTVDYATADRSATAGEDYAETTGTALILRGQSSTTVTVPVNGDTTFEGDETYDVMLSNPQNAEISDDNGVGTITNDDAQPPPPTPPTVSVSNAERVEGDSGSSPARFTVSLNQATDHDVHVQFSTSNGSASFGSDYSRTNVDVVIPAGTTGKFVNVPVLGDTTVEPNETFTATLSDPNGATLGDESGTGTITNDDEEPPPPPADPTVSVSSESGPEGDEGTSNQTFTVDLSHATDHDVFVDYATSDDSATAGSDYAAASGTVRIPAGETFRTFDVTVNGDTDEEPDESFNVTLSDPNGADPGDMGGTGTIANDGDTGGGGAGSSTVWISDAPNVIEGNSGARDATYTIRMETVQSEDVTVDWRTMTATGTASAGSDYTNSSGVATIPAGQRSTTVRVPILGDKTFEQNERVWVRVSNAQGGTAEVDPTPTGPAQDSDGRAVIVNDDTDVNLNGSNAEGTRVHVKLGTNPNAGGDRVVVFRKAQGEVRELWTGNLNATGGLDRTLPNEFNRGATVNLFARVTTGNGNYWSNGDTVTIN